MTHPTGSAGGRKRQMWLSLVVALLLAAATVAVVSQSVGPGEAALEQRREAAEERREAAEDRRDERRDALEDRRGE